MVMFYRRISLLLFCWLYPYDCFSKFEPTDQYDLYDAFKKAADEDSTLDKYTNFDFEEYYRVWVNEPGYPLLEVEVDHTTGNIKLSQVSFFKIFYLILYHYLAYLV